MTGRPTKLTPEVADAIIRMTEAGVPRTEAARAVGIHRATLFEWLRRGETETELGDQLDPNQHTKTELQAIARQRNIDIPTRATKADIAETLNNQPSPYADFADRLRAADGRYMAYAVNELRRVGADDWRAWAWMLERRFPDQFGRSDRDTSATEAGTPDDAAAALNRGEEIVVKILENSPASNVRSLPSDTTRGRKAQ